MMKRRIAKKTLRKSLRKRMSRRNKNNKKSRINNMKGGFNTCVLGTVSEAGLSIPDMGSVKGLTIKDSNAVIYRPHCQGKGIGDAMVPN